MMGDTTPLAGAPKYRIAAGASLGEVYTDLFKRYNVTLPGGTCGSVGAGGHITGGGYGILSRPPWVNVGWLSAVDIFTFYAKGKFGSRRCVRTHQSDILPACP